MMGPSTAATSFDVDHEAIEPTSVLFRARHMGNLSRHGADQDNAREAVSIGRVS
jgi:hypothetical protein